MNPRNVNAMHPWEPRWLLSLQYTILVLSGWGSSPTSPVHCRRAANTWCVRILSDRNAVHVLASAASRD